GREIGNRTVFHINESAVRTAHRVFTPVLAGLEKIDTPCTPGVLIVPKDKKSKLLTEQIMARQMKNRACRRIDGHDALIVVQHDQTVLRALKERAILLFV